MGAVCASAKPISNEEKTKLTTRDAPSDGMGAARWRSTDTDFRFQAETMRLVGYGGFWVVVLAGIIITHATKGWYEGGAPADLSHSLLTQVFGYNNICIYFDYPPANYVLPVLWAVVLLLLLAYLATQWLHIQGRCDQGSFTYAQRVHLQGYLVVAACSLIVFSNIFAVSPTGHNRTLWIHTIPFWCLQLGMVCLAIGNTLQGVLAAPGKTSYFTELGFTPCAQQAAWAYVAVFALIVLFKIPAAFNAMLGQPFWTQTDSFMLWAGVMDRGFLLCAAVLPVLKSLYLLAYKSHLLEGVDIDVDVRKRGAVRGKKTGSEVYATPEGGWTTHKQVGYWYIQLDVENVRLFGYAGFWVVVLAGIIITNLTKGWYEGGAPADLSHSLLTHVFGYNNICIYFDYPPANYVLPVLWAVVLPCLVFYALVDIAHAFGRWEDGNLTRNQYKLLRALQAVAVLSLIVFSNIFAVSPTGHNRTLWIHTIPFWCLQLGMVCLAIGNTLQGTLAAPGRASYWTELGFTPCAQQAAWAYVAVFALIVLFKIPAAFNAMLGQPFWTQGPTFNAVAGWFDRGFLLCAALLPMLKSLYFTCAMGPKLDIIVISTQIYHAGDDAHPRAPTF